MNGMGASQTMRYFPIILALIGLTGSLLFGSHAYGLWIAQSPDVLLEQSQTIFVGNITLVKVLKFEKSSIYNVEENGIERQVIENYTLSLDEYTVSVEEFLKNPQNSDMMTVRQPTTGVVGQVAPIGSFQVGDRVLLYLEKIDEENTYSPESFKIPESCDAKSVLEQPRIQFGNSFSTMQEGIKKEDNFTANTPIQFVYEKDTRTLFGKSFAVYVGISKKTSQNMWVIFEKDIHVESNPCEWMASAVWEFTPEKGDYRMFVGVKEDGSISTSDTGFSVITDTEMHNIAPPLKQFRSGTPIDKIVCKEGLVRLIKINDNSPICVKPKTVQKLVERGLAFSSIDIHKNSDLVVPRGDLLPQNINDTYQREITILSISPQNLTLPEPKSQTSKTTCNADGVCFTPE